MRKIKGNIKAMITRNAKMSADVAIRQMPHGGIEVEAITFIQKTTFECQLQTWLLTEC